MDNVKRMKTWGLVLFYVSLYTPIYKGNIFGASYSANVADLGQPLVVNLVALVAVLFALFANHLRPKLTKAGDITAIVVMGVAILLFSVAKAAGDSFGMAFYLILIATTVMVFATFFSTPALKGYEFIDGLLGKVFDLLREKNREEAPEEEVVVEPAQPKPETEFYE